ncbi:MAG: cytochrome c biogenesis protein CcdA, partial [Acidobacteriota bacterium]
GLTVDAVRYPEGEVLDAPALGGNLSVYNDGVVFGATAQVAPDLPEGAQVLRGSVIYQACNDRTCLFPKTVSLEFPVSIARSAAAAPLHPEIFAVLDGAATTGAGGDVDAAPEAGSTVAAQIASRGFTLWLLGVFVLGLALNLTPCVYPVIAVTLSYFGRQGGGGGGQLLRATAYAAGIAATFTALFLVAGLTGQMFGAWLQSPWVLGGLAAVLVVLALSNFGLFEIQAPAALRNRVAGGRTGVVGALGMGLAMGIVAAPCVGPLIAGLLLWVGQQGDVGNALLVGIALSAGLALPYVLLGMFSGSLAAMPRSGQWMEWIKHAMGFILLGVALYFLASFLPQGWFLPSFAVLVAVAGIWLALLDRAGRGNRVLRVVRTLVLVGALVAAALLVRLEGREGIDWEPYTPQAVAEAAVEGRPVLIEFTAAWCFPCRVLENGPFKDPAVIAASEGFRRLRVDLTGEEPGALEAVERYHVPGPPVMVFLDAEGRERADLRMIEAVDAAELLDRMRAARGAAADLE